MRLAGVAEIAELLGVTRQAAQQTTTRPQFPAPVAKLRMGPVWRLDDVKRWARSTGRYPHV